MKVSGWLCLVPVLALAGAPVGDEWENLSKQCAGKEPARAWFSSFPCVESAKAIRPEANPNRLSLDSEKDWHFNWCRKPGERPVDFYKPAYDVSAWPIVKVPCSWQSMGIRASGERFGVPIYVNQHFIFTPKAPKNYGMWPKVTGHPLPENYTMKPEDNPVGSYRRDFELPAEWTDGEIFLEFDGVDSFFYAWVNGEYLGFSKDSRSPSVFDITKYVKPGKNVVAVEVYRNCDGSYLEAQDMFRLSGIFRSVSVYRTPKAFVRDVFFTTEPLEKGNYAGAWKVNLRATLANRDAASATRVLTAQVFDSEGRAVELGGERQLKLSADAGAEATGEISFTVERPLLWSAELPNLYTLVLASERWWSFYEALSFQLGFRQVEITTPADPKDRTFLVNGQPIKMKGANRHEVDPLYGHYTPDSRIEQDVRMLKEANCNHVRNAHYPQPGYFYYLCNKYGIYVMDEANIESHGFYYGKGSISHPVEWKQAHVFRLQNMVERNKNQPCVVIWSLGNEAGPGDNFKACYAKAKELDPSRPAQYERNNDITDMGSCQYPGVGWTWKTAAGESQVKFPYHINEYAHNMNNAMGNLKDYQDAIESSDRICGSAIWDWVDQGQYMDTTGGVRILAYGGDFGDQPNDGQFVMNGTVLSDREPEPGYFEVKHVFQNFSVTLDKSGEKGGLLVRNKNYFRTADYVDARWMLLENGKIVGEGELALPEIAPQQTVSVPFPEKCLRYNRKPQCEYALRVEFALKRDEGMLKAGYVVAADQVEAESLPIADDSLIGACVNGTVAVEDVGNERIYTTGTARVVFDRTTGALAHYIVSGRDLLKAPLKVDAFRAPSSNEEDLGGEWCMNGLRVLSQRALEFRDEGARGNGPLYLRTKLEVRGVRREKLVEFVRACTKIVDQGPTTEEDTHFIVHAVWAICPDGTVACDSVFEPKGRKLELARLGYDFIFGDELSQVSYFGRGPFENYSDRQSGAFAGVWKTTVEKMVEHYARPQEMGNRGETRWVSLLDAAGKGGVVVRAVNAPFAFSALPLESAELIGYAHAAELPKKTGKTVLSLFAKARGLGGASCGPRPLEPDLVPSTRAYELAFTLSPLTGEFAGGTTLRLPPADLPRDGGKGAAVSSGAKDDGPVVAEP